MSTELMAACVPSTVATDPTDKAKPKLNPSQIQINGSASTLFLGEIYRGVPEVYPLRGKSIPAPRSAAGRGQRLTRRRDDGG
jgi:hypothetical protein